MPSLVILKIPNLTSTSPGVRNRLKAMVMNRINRIARMPRMI